MSDSLDIGAVLLDFSGVVARVRRTFVGEDFDTDYVIEPLEGMIDAIVTLRRRGVRCVLVSNNDRHDLLREATSIPFEELFDAMVFSSDAGASKPAPAIYEAAVAASGSAAAQCLFIDDVATNVEGAEAVGVRGLVAESAEQVVKVLNSIDSR